MVTLLSVENLEHYWKRERQAQTAPVNLRKLTVSPGQCLALVGQSGSGKTTVVLAAAGLLQQGVTLGRISRFADCGPGGLGVVLQNPETQILSSQVLDEVMLGLLTAGMDTDAARDRARRALDQVGLAARADQPTDALSMGQKYRLCLAAMLAMSPRLWLLDEPLSQLDAEGRAMLARLMADHLGRGGGVLLTSHDPPDIPGITLDSVRMGPELPDAKPKTTFPAAAPGNGTVVELRGVEYAFDADHVLYQGLDLQVRQGERVVVCGDNGSGKSTLTALLTGMIRPDSGTVAVAGVERPKPDTLSGRVALVPQDPDYVITEATVADEVAFSPRQWRREKAGDTASFWMEALGLSGLAQEPPLGLSYGQKRLVTMAAAMAAEPELLILDEPFSGLDGSRMAALAQAVAVFQETHPEAAVLCLTHDQSPSLDLDARSLHLRQGRLQ